MHYTDKCSQHSSTIWPVLLNGWLLSVWLRTKWLWVCVLLEFLDCNRTQTHNHLVYKLTLNHLAKLAKWLSCVVSTYLYRADKSLQSINWVVSAATGLFPFNQALINFVHFCLNIQIFCPFLPFLTFLCLFLPFLSKIALMSLLSVIGPAKKWTTHVNFAILYKKVSSIKISIWWH